MIELLHEGKFSDLWKAIQNSYRTRPERYLEHELPTLQERAQHLAIAPVLYVKNLDEMESAYELAPFALPVLTVNISDLERWALQEAFTQVRGLHIYCYALHDHLITKVLEKSGVKPLHLTLSAKEFSEDLMNSLATHTCFEALTHLGFTRTGYLSSYKRLPEIKLLSQSSTLKALTHLDLTKGYIGPRATKTLLDSPLMAQLTHLNLSRCRLNARSIEYLAKSTQLDNLTHLTLSSNDLGKDGLVPLAYASNLPRLASLDAKYCELGLSSVQALANAPSLRLRSLNIESNRIRGACKTIATSDTFTQLERLNLKDVEESPEALAHLSASSTLGNLRHLMMHDAHKVINTSKHMTQCNAMTWGPLQPATFQSEATTPHSEDPDGWHEAFGELRAFIQEYSQSKSLQLWDWINANSRKFPDLYTSQALPYLDTWSTKLHEPPLFKANSMAELKTIHELAPFARVALEDDHIKATDLKKGLMKAVQRLQLSYPGSQRSLDARVKSLATSKNLGNLRQLTTISHKFDARHLKEMIQSGLVSQLTHLHLIGTFLQDRDTAPLFDAKLPQLEHLLLSPPSDISSLTLSGVSKLAQSSLLTSLTSLRGVIDTDDKAIALSKAICGHRLRLIEVYENVSHVGLEALVTSEHLPSLDTLLLYNVKPEAVKALATHPGAKRLTHIAFMRGQKEDYLKGLRHLIHSPLMDSLEHLTLDSYRVNDEELAEMSDRCERLPDVRYLQSYYWDFT